MKRKAIISLILVAVLAFGAGMGTIAYFTSQATSTGNTFTAGKLTVGLNATGGQDTSTAYFSPSGVAPGDPATPAPVTIYNTGDLAFKYKVTAFQDTTATGSGDAAADLAVYNALTITITDSSNIVLYSGLLSGLTDVILRNGTSTGTNPGSIDGGHNEVLTFAVQLPSTAGNACQGGIANIKFTFDATQTTNAGWVQ